MARLSHCLAYGTLRANQPWGQRSDAKPRQDCTTGPWSSVWLYAPVSAGPFHLFCVRQPLLFVLRGTCRCSVHAVFSAAGFFEPQPIWLVSAGNADAVAEWPDVSASKKQSRDHGAHLPALLHARCEQAQSRKTEPPECEELIAMLSTLPTLTLPAIMESGGCTTDPGRLFKP